MASSPRSRSWGDVLAELGPSARLLTQTESQFTFPVSGPSLWWGGALPEDPHTVLVCPPIEDAGELAAVLERLPAEPERLIVLTAPSPIPAEELGALADGHAIIEVEAVNPAEVVIALAGAALSPEESVTRRLSSLQRRLTQVLGDVEPITSLAHRLKSLCNATVALVDRHGTPIHATGPIPMSLLFGEIARTPAETQVIDRDGWHGVADRVTDPSQGGEHVGWLIVATRRANFPDPYTTAAVHVATTLVEASLRIATVAQQQERAIRAAVLEEAVGLQRQPYDAELAGRIASFGLSFDDDLRAILLQPRRMRPVSRGAFPAAELADRLSRALNSASISHLMSVRDKSIVLLAQCTPAMLNRVVVANGLDLSGSFVGIGRRIVALGGIPDSYHDAQLAIRTLVRNGPGQSLMTYEEFDFATRLFAEVGLDRMSAWARQFLEPLQARGVLAQGLQAFLDHDQNIITAAESLGIHHNSLRYRLSKVEELLQINLREPSAISSLFLALAAVDLDRRQAALPPKATRSGRHPQAFDIDAPISTGYSAPAAEGPGVVRGPD
jgi:hypothetical protein